MSEIFKKVEDIIVGLEDSKVREYTKYWKDIAPGDNDEYFKRWMFSFLSVHTTWSKNVDAYNLLKDMSWVDDKHQLSNLIIQSGVGLHHIRIEGIWKFYHEFYSDPSAWYKQKDETWQECRNRLMEKCYGLGIAKSTFALEMCYPESCEVACLDVHMLRLYGKGSRVKKSEYAELEKHWVKTCKENNIPAFIARNLYWDTIQKKSDTRYWTYVFENEKSSSAEGSN